MLDVVVVDGRARGIVTRDLVTGKVEAHVARRGGPRHRRLRQRLLPLDERQGLQHDRDLARPQARRLLREPLLHADPPDVHPRRRRVPVQAHAHERVAAQRRPHLGARRRRATRASRARSPRASATTTSSARYPAFGNLVPRDVASRAAKQVCDEGRGVGPGGRGVYLDFDASIRRLGDAVDPRALRQPLRDVRAHHRRGPVQGPDAHLPGHPLHDGRALGRLRPDEHHPRAVRDGRGELLRSRRQPPRRQRAHAGPRRRLLHPAVHHRQLPRAGQGPDESTPIARGIQGRGRRASRRRPRSSSPSRASARSTRSTASSASSSGRTAAWPATRPASRRRSPRSPRSARSSGRTCAIPGTGAEMNQELEKAGRVADFLELGELMCFDALEPQGVVRRPLPRGVPDARRRGAARRRRVLLRGRLGVQGPGRAAGARTKSRSPSSTSTSRRGATSDAHLLPDPPRVAPEERRRRRASSSSTRRPTSASTCRSSRCSTS